MSKQVKPKVLIVCHQHLYAPRRGGGETSMAIIAEYLDGCGYDVAAWVGPISNTPSVNNTITFLSCPLEAAVAGADIVLSWGRPALQAFHSCQRFNVPFILCVRWWRNIVDVSGAIGDLSKQMRGHWHNARQEMFSHAAAVITNNEYSAGIIERFYNRKALVSYVPILGKPNPVGCKDGAIVAISPNKGIGERRAILDIEAHLPQEERIIIVNAKARQYHRSKIKVLDHSKDLTPIWAKAKLMIQPIYHNDICGTLRTTIEAQQHGVPVIANNRCGLWEKVPANNLVSYYANTKEWVDKIREVSEQWEERSREALSIFQGYDTPRQLEVFKIEIDKALSVKPTA